MPAFLDDDDATLLAAYDGLRRGFEEAHLPRVCRRRRDGNDDAAWARAALDVSGGGAPLVVAFGRALCDRVAALPFLRPDGRGRIPCVYVETTATTRLGALADRADPAPPCAVVRAESSIEAIAGVLRRLFPRRERPRVGLAWAADAARPWRDALEAAGARTQVEGAPSSESVDAILDAPIGLGERPLAFDAALARARALGVPLVSLDRGRFGRGASVVICPDGALVGRVAAEAARRLRDGEGADRALRLSVRTLEVLVDLDAVDAQALSIPIELIASADRVRSTRARPTAGSPK